MGKSFSVSVSYEGYENKLWQQRERRRGVCGTGGVVFAIENACNLCKTLVGYLTVKWHNKFQRIVPFNSKFIFQKRIRIGKYLLQPFLRIKEKRPEWH